MRDEGARGELVPVLEAFCEPFSGQYLYHRQRRHASPALRALVDYLRGTRRPESEPAATCQPWPWSWGRSETLS